MKYIRRLLEKKYQSLLATTDRNDRNDRNDGVDACQEGTKKNEDIQRRPLTETTETISVAVEPVSVVSVSTSHGRSPDFIPAESPSVQPWLPRPTELANWPIEWRERWGRLANQFEDEGVPFPESERHAFHQVKSEMAKREAS